MNIQERFLDIKHFLSPFENNWSHEVINYYPTSMGFYKDQWLKELSQLTDEQLWSLDCRYQTTPLPEGELKSIFEKIRQLEVMPVRDFLNKKQFPTWAFANVKGKKLHEIQRILPIVSELKDSLNINKAVDIGGGKGHLARILSYYEGIETTTIDFNKEFQDLGKKRAKKYPLPDGAKPIHFYNHEFSDESTNDATLKKLFNEENGISLGLHTCGPLSLKHMDMFLQNKNTALINFGCCYSKLNTKSEVNISNFAKENFPLPINNFALSLATRGHNIITFDEFNFKVKVKSKRYLLHLLMIEKLGFKEFISVGQGSNELYSNSFKDYAKIKLNEIGYDLKMSDEELDSYENSAKNKELIKKLFLANIVRWQFGRLIELYVLLDRCIYLKENGASKVEITEVFTNEISPRNLAIISNK